MLNNLQKAGCPECGEKLSSKWYKKVVKREKPKWNEFSQYYVYQCPSCKAELKFQAKDSILTSIVFSFIILCLVPMFFIYSYIFDSYGQGWAAVFMFAEMVFLIPVIIFLFSKLKLVRDY